GLSNHGLAVADVHCTAVLVEPCRALRTAAVARPAQRAMAAAAALQIGASEGQERRTVAYGNERVQFDRPIGTFQAVQMSMADGHIAIEGLRSSLFQLCYRLDQNMPSDAEALATRFLSTETAHVVGHKAQHVHGGIGVDLTYPIHRFLYWSRHLSLVLCGSAATLERRSDD